MDQIDTVYLLGAGCVEGAWDPVLRAVSRVAKTEIARGEADWWFSAHGQFLHLLSSWQAMTDEQLESRFGEGEHDKSRAAMRQELLKAQGRLEGLKSAIAEELHGAHARNDIGLKKPLIKLLARDAGEGSTAFLTSNWDLCLEQLLQDDQRPARVTHLHGDIRDPLGMLLPGERPEELFRGDDGNASISHAYWTASLLFGMARRIYVAGLSLSVLDAALGTLLGMGCKPNQPGEIVIVNLSEQTERIRRQLQLVVPPCWTIRELHSDTTSRR